VDFGDTATTGILVATAVLPVTGVQIVGNQISNVHFGIFTQKVTTTTPLQKTNSFFHVDVSVHEQ
jgi:nitrous oxidase accessory protein NosD